MDLATGWGGLKAFIDQGGVAMWAIALLAALTAGLVVWKLVRLSLMGAWASGRAESAVRSWVSGARATARESVGRGRGLYTAPLAAAFDALSEPGFSPETRREEIARVAAGSLARARGGLRGLELIATVAPLIGLLGTVLGMISAFQALEEAGARADPAALAGGIWEALLTTAAGMAVAIPASVTLTWFESLADKAQGRIEDMATRLLVADETGEAEPTRILEIAE